MLVYRLTYDMIEQYLDVVRVPNAPQTNAEKLKSYAHNLSM